MSVNYSYPKLLESILDTLMVFDIVKVRVSALELYHSMLYISPNMVDFKSALQLLENKKIIHQQDGLYQLYIRQVDTYSELNTTNSTGIKFVEPILRFLFQFESLAILSLGTRNCYFISFWPKTSLAQKEQRTKILTKLLGKPVYFMQSTKPNLKSELGAVLLSQLKWSTKKQAHKSLNWIKRFVPQQQFKFNHRIKPLRIQSGQPYSNFSINQFLNELNKEFDFDSLFDQRQQTVKQWILPQLGKSTKQNRIV